MSGYTLYGYPESGSACVEVAMVDAGIPFEMRDLDEEAGDLQSAEFLSVNPRGQVPALVHPDGSIITEVPAILLHLADAHPESHLAPPPGTSARAQHDRWLAFAHANCYEAVLRLFYSDRYITDPAHADLVSASALTYLVRHFNLLADAIAEGPFVFGDTPMAVDYLIWVLTTWLEDAQLAEVDPKIIRLANAIAARPNLADAVARNTGS